MSLHKLTAGAGYEYLTRQVAAQDATDKGGVGLATYYTQSGETPGRWVGSGLAGLEQITAGDLVTAEQMRHLFGAGHHPNAAAIMDGLIAAGVHPSRAEKATRLGAQYPRHTIPAGGFQARVAAAVAAHNRALGRPGDAPVAVEVRATIRDRLATTMFRDQYGRDPADARELAATIAKHTRPHRQAVAGYDLTFSPVKSVSTLWALADRHTAALVERAHNAAVADALAWIETHALYTREGPQGVRQVATRGLVATAFTHRDSRAGDPDLHTHVAVANKVQAVADGAWLAIDGRVLYKANVSASEVYNTALETHLHDLLGVTFTARTDTTPGTVPVREIDGIRPELMARWSSRRAAIDARRADLSAAFQTAHGRPPTAVEAIQLAQQATLETRAAKHEPRTLAEQRRAWAAEAREVLGSDTAIAAMIESAVHHHTPGPWGPVTDEARVEDLAYRVLTAVQARRATWQVWHVGAEAHRQVRATDLTQLNSAQVDEVIAAVTDQVLTQLCVPVADDADGIPDPDPLRRADGTSVYQVAGATLYTSPATLAAEHRIVAAATLTGGRTVPADEVDLALLEATANGLTLNTGQVELVRAMTTSGARVQVAIAPAGSGKTTAMTALTLAWATSGGTILGLAPSAAAAAQLRDHITTPTGLGPAATTTTTTTDTLAKLAWDLTHNRREPWDTLVDARTLIVIDEAGMADTLTLDTAITYAISRGASVRLVGDDQQLAAVGAGGVLRDIATAHGAIRLAELHRFADPAEAAATLALRDGKHEALGFYLDHGRVHVGDTSTNTEQVFAAWQDDRSAGLDAIMLAPTRDLVADLNARARRWLHHGTTPPERQVPLADGNHGGVGDILITRRNDRRLAFSPTDFVKNGDRWTILAITGLGAGDERIVVRHHGTGRQTRLPARYAAAYATLGYATTIHGAQGVTADTTHGLLAGTETRQQLYTMATRGRLANHLYLTVVGDGDDHALVRPDTTHPPTATDLLETVLDRDGTAVSAGTATTHAADPTTRLTTAAPRYADAVHVAAAHLIDPHLLTDLDAHADDIIPDLTDAPAWPALRAALTVAAADGHHPLTTLTRLAQGRELDTAADPAAVLEWRLHTHTHTHAAPAPTGTDDDDGRRMPPLPWLPTVPAALVEHPTWGPYLAARADLVRDLAHQVHTTAAADTTSTGGLPVWARHHHTGALTPQILGAIAVWRAATGVHPTDPRPTGAPQVTRAARLHQTRLDRHLAATASPAWQEWAPLLTHLTATARHDPYLPALAESLAHLHRTGIHPAPLIQHAITTGGPLPDDHPMAALWWRLTERLTPTVAAAATEPTPPVPAAWVPDLADIIGAERAATCQASPLWPALIAAVDTATARGWSTTDILTTALPPAGVQDPADLCQAMTWRINLLTDPTPYASDDEPRLIDIDDNPPPHDLHDDAPIPHDALTPDDLRRLYDEPCRPESPTAPTVHDDPDTDGDLDDIEDLAAELDRLARIRDTITVLEPSEAMIERAVAFAADQHFSPVTPERIAHLNATAAAFYTAHLNDTWAGDYLIDRLIIDPALAADRYGLGYAPAGWTHLVSHLRNHGATDDELLNAGLARVTTTGRLIDTYRDRLIIPITHGPDVVGFAARRNPTLPDTDPYAGPKYLNTATTPLYSKSRHLYTADPTLPGRGAVPVLVEGPLDAIAVSYAGAGQYVGVAPLGTALTEEHAHHLAHLAREAGPDRPVIVATDADLPGDLAADRAYWILTPHGLDPRRALFIRGDDPAELHRTHGPSTLVHTLERAIPLGDIILDERLTNIPRTEAIPAAAAAIAARPPATWPHLVTRAAAHLGPDSTRHLYAAVASAARNLTTEPHSFVADQVGDNGALRARLAAAAELPPTRRWAPAAAAIQPSLILQDDWPTLAANLDDAHRHGQHVPTMLHDLTRTPLGNNPIDDLRHRITGHLDNAARDTTATGSRTTLRPSRHRQTPTHANRRTATPRR